MNNENKYEYINNLPKDYQKLLWEIMIKADSNNLDNVVLNKHSCKLLMRYLYKKDKEIELLNNIINELEEKIDNLNNSINSIIDYLKSKGE